MSGSRIPNLLSVKDNGNHGSDTNSPPRGGRGGRVGRGRGTGRRRPGSTGFGAQHDQVIQSTDTDAAVSRLSAVEFGYLEDVFAKLFVQGPATQRLPIIRRGTYTRTWAIDSLIEAFLSDLDPGSKEPQRQIVSLGAGTDTRPLKIFSSRPTHGLIYHELDFHNIVLKKVNLIRKNSTSEQILPLSDQSREEEEEEDEHHPPPQRQRAWSSKPPSGGEYHCHGIDLRQLSAPSSSGRPTALPGLRTDVPTVLISECCLCYLSPSDASNSISFFTSQMADIAIIIYEPMQPHDPFGQMMVSNLRQRRIHMPTLESYPAGEDQDRRLKQAGFERTNWHSIEQIWDELIGEKERERIDRLEGLDEVEEWKLLASHYILVWGSKGRGFEKWKPMQAQLEGRVDQEKQANAETAHWGTGDTVTDGRGVEDAESKEE